MLLEKTTSKRPGTAAEVAKEGGGKKEGEIVIAIRRKKEGRGKIYKESEEREKRDEEGEGSGKR